jgi:regulator of sigma E protease
VIVWGLLLFALLVVVHELGHFVAARREGVEVEEFGIGFPPRLVGRRMGRGLWRSYYSLNLLPLGGFVRLKGENEADKRRGAYGAVSFAAKARITLAGVAMNYLVAVTLISIVAAIRLPVLFDSQFTVPADTTELRRDVVAVVVADGSAAEAAGLRPGDVIRQFAGQPLTSADQLAVSTRARAGQTVDMEVERGGERISLQARLKADPADGRSFLGVGPKDVIEHRSSWSAPIVGFVVTNQIGWESLKLLGSAVTSLLSGHGAAAADGLTGPVGLVGVLRSVQSFTQLLLLTGIISLSLAIMNALPIPALDGGRLALSALFRLLRKELRPRLENAVHTAGFVALIVLVILISIVDARRFF